MEAVLRYAGRTVLDVGCATGDYVNLLNRRGYFAAGLDLLADARWRLANPHRFVQGSGARLPFPEESFDSVIAFETLEHIPDPERALSEFRRVCASNVILSVPNCETPEELLRAGLIYAHWRDRTHCNFFTIENLGELLEKCGFRVVSIARSNPILPDYLVLRSLHLPASLAFFASRVLRRLPPRKPYFMTLLAVAVRV
jgi:ubiquinone/menaquinone biosynthesis C-methylase UbiE